MQVLITGGAGYIGNELVLRLLKMPHVSEIVVYDNLSRKNYNLFLDKRFDLKEIRFLNGELLDTKTLHEEVKKADVIYHLAGIDNLLYAGDNPYPFDQVNNWGTAELVYAVEASYIKKFFYLSTTDVYGTQSRQPDLKDQPFPETFYAKSKLNGENHVKKLFSQCKSYIFRVSDVYGYSPSAKFDSSINKLLFDVNFMGRIHIHGTGKQIRDYIHVSKVVEVLTGILEAQNAPESGIYNLTDKNIGIEEIAQTFKEIYPGMGEVYLHQHEESFSRSIEKDPILETFKSQKSLSFKEEIEDFKNNFSFSRRAELAIPGV
ncbi:MAG: NAD-dependent epimerase/dehydratase family protein [Bacteroidales bacterium]